MPHRNEHTVNIAMQIRKYRLRPISRPSQPATGTTIPFATRYDVSVQVASSLLADSAPAMFGRLTLTIVVSRISMNGASVAAPATSQTLPRGRHVASCQSLMRSRLRRWDGSPGLIRATASARCTVGTAERPSGSGRSGSMPVSIRIFTGTRWTIFTKLPVAFSGGNAVKREPEPSWMLSTWPVSFRLRIGIDADVHLLAGAHAVELGFLEVGGDPDLRGDDRQDRLAGLHVVALLDVALGDPAVLRRGDPGP